MKPTFLIIRKADGSTTEYINTNHILRVIYTLEQNCQALSSVFTIKDLLKIIGQDPDKQGLQQQIAHFLQQEGWYKVRRTYDGQKQYVWVKES